MALFNNTRDEDTQGDFPNLRFYDQEQQEEVELVKQWVEQFGNDTEMESAEQFLKVLEPKIHAHSCDQFINGSVADTKWLSLRDGGSCRMPSVATGGPSRIFINYGTGAVCGEVEVRRDSLEGPSVGRIPLPLPRNWEERRVGTECVYRCRK